MSLGFGEVEVAERCGLSVYEYGDIEQHRNEFFDVVHLRQARCLCEVLGLDPFAVFDLDCAFCTGDTVPRDDFSLPRNELVRKMRVARRFSQDELGDEIGFETAAIENMENDPDFFESWSIELVSDLAAILKIPPQILLRIKCSKCGR